MHILIGWIVLSTENWLTHEYTNTRVSYKGTGSYKIQTVTSQSVVLQSSEQEFGCFVIEQIQHEFDILGFGSC